MKCGECERALACLFDVGRADAEDPEMRAHLATCDDCRELLGNFLLIRAFGNVARGCWGRLIHRAE
jgi:hypothetical protein